MRALPTVHMGLYRGCCGELVGGAVDSVIGPFGEYGFSEAFIPVIGPRGE